MGGFRRLVVDVGSLGIKRAKAMQPLGAMMVRRGFATTSTSVLLWLLRLYGLLEPVLHLSLGPWDRSCRP
jgi:hypothetical protein